MSRVDDSIGYLKAHADLLPKPERTLAMLVLSDPQFRAGYGATVGTTHAHHAYPGGLVVHTAEVLQYAANLTASLNINPLVLKLAVIYHDCAKVLDYDALGQKTPHYGLIRHVAGSYAEWMYQSAYMDRDFRDAVGHCILAHHGRKEWGSPVEPQTVEAMILHQADMWSATYGPGRNGA